MAEPATDHEDVLEQNTNQNSPIFLGLTLCILGALGLCRMVLLAMVSVSLDVWLSFGMLFVGMAMMLAEPLGQRLQAVQMHQMPGQFLSQQIRVGQRVWLLASMPQLSRDDVRIVLTGVSPTLARFIAAPDFRGSLDVLVEAAKAACQAWWPQASSNQKPGEADRHSDIRGTEPAAEGAERDTGEAEAVLAAIAWLKKPQLSMCFDDQLVLYGMAKQAQDGDAPDTSVKRLTALCRAKRASWAVHKGLTRQEAGKRLLQRLLEMDPGFRSAKPQLVLADELAKASAATQADPFVSPSIDMTRLGLELLERRVPADLDELALRTKKRLLTFFAMLIVILPLFQRFNIWRRVQQRLRKMPVMTIASAITSSYLLVLSHGLPASVHHRLPPTIRALPSTAAGFAENMVGGGSAGRLARFAVQLLLPPVAGGLLLE